jgi:hypothetical protein
MREFSAAQAYAERANTRGSANSRPQGAKHRRSRAYGEHLQRGRRLFAEITRRAVAPQAAGRLARSLCAEGTRLGLPRALPCGLRGKTRALA